MAAELSAPPHGGETAAQASRRRLLMAARVCFGRSGYRGTTTKEIAEVAGLAEKTLFRHFPTKVELFEAAVVTPLSTFISEYFQTWADRPRNARPTEVSVREFYAEALDVLDEHGPLLTALVAAKAFGSTDAAFEAQLTTSLGEMLEGLDVIGAKVQASGRSLHPHITPRLMFAMVAAVSFFDGWLFGTGDQPSREAVLDELTALTVTGLTGPRGST